MLLNTDPGALFINIKTVNKIGYAVMIFFYHETIHDAMVFQVQHSGYACKF